MGRPTDFNQEIGLTICEKLVEGQSLRSICLDDAMPSISTIMLWLTKHQEFSEQYAHARDAQADTLADEILDIADDASNDWMEVHKGDSVSWQENGEAIQRSRLRVDTRKWIATKLKSKKYGDKVEQTHKGDKEAPIMITATDARL
jgi:hypothetical protein